jgi:hypothetical protein
MGFFTLQRKNIQFEALHTDGGSIEALCFSLGSEENKPRRVTRSVSEGNLHLLDVQRKKSIFYKTSQKFKSVTKRM